MMTELQFLDRGQRKPSGEWACTKPINVKSPSGPVVIHEGATFVPGALFLVLDLAKELDQMSAKHRSPAAQGAQFPDDPYGGLRGIPSNASV